MSAPRAPGPLSPEDWPPWRYQALTHSSCIQFLPCLFQLPDPFMTSTTYPPNLPFSSSMSSVQFKLTVVSITVDAIIALGLRVLPPPLYPPLSGTPFCDKLPEGRALSI